MKLTIKQKLYGMVVFTVLAFAALFGRQIYVLSETRTMEEARLLDSEINAGMLTLRRNEKDFLARTDLKYLDKFNKNFVLLTEKLTSLKAFSSKYGVVGEEVARLERVLNDYAVSFKQLVAVQQTIGLSPKDGLRGNLRNAVHEAEGILKELSLDTLTKDMLMLRRREKDFMLRTDIKYLEKFNNDLVVFYQDLDAVSLSSEKKAEIRSSMAVYERDFTAMVQAYQNKGLTSKAGLQGQMRDTVHQSETVLAEVSEKLTAFLEQELTKLIAVGLVMFVGLFLAVIVSTFLMSRSILIPVKRLQAVMSDACENKDLSLRADAHGHDEITSMAQTFNAMLAEFQQMVSKVLDSVHAVSVASTQLSSVTEQTANGVMKQHRESDQVATAMNEMSATVEEVARNANEAASASHHADDAARNGKDIVVAVKSGIHALAAEIDTAATTIADLQKQTDNIGGVLNVIRDIAEQTNLLALNAAIEAARAGEQGRGFAVVADEVRTLATRTQESTAEIQAMIENLQAAAKTAVSTMDKGKQVTAENVSKADEADQALNEISTSVRSINDMNAMIASAAEEQSAVAEEINRSVVTISQISDETAEGAKHTTATASDLAALAMQLQTLATQFRVGSVHVDLTAAKSAHLAWKTRIRDFLDGKGGLTKEQAVSHHDCVLGKWYYSEGIEKYGHIQEMKDVEQPHAELHTTIREIIELREKGDTQASELAYKRIEPLSSKIVAYLTAIERKAN
ncbi:MAG: methyl-accepting chemotaxis protein [Gammaproteobacteria bacterium]|nr:methyl-accepting chemotaxis protein [Gammaproteobacteria bacterium]